MNAHSAAFVQLSDGRCVDLLAPDLAGISPSALSVSLARIPRFNGHTLGTYPYSVAQHSVLVAEMVHAWGGTAHQVAAALLHDAHEALMGDIATPVKRALGRVVDELEARLQAAVFTRFGLDPALAHCDLLRTADGVALATERRDLLAPSAWPWPGGGYVAADVRVEPISPTRAEILWIARLNSCRAVRW